MLDGAKQQKWECCLTSVRSGRLHRRSRYVGNTDPPYVEAQDETPRPASAPGWQVDLRDKHQLTADAAPRTQSIRFTGRSSSPSLQQNEKISVRWNSQADLTDSGITCLRSDCSVVHHKASKARCLTGRRGVTQRSRIAHDCSQRPGPHRHVCPIEQVG